jgi:mRNA interferase MazF
VKRGDLVPVAIPGDFGKPRPALVIQSDQFDGTATVTVLLLSGTLVDAPLIRLDVEPSPENGLRKRSQVMVDKAMTVRRDKLGEPFGRLDDGTIVAVTRSLTLFLGFA